ncbi:MAG: FIST N-terminal domain-containing protein [Myxococcota bacterium]
MDVVSIGPIKADPARLAAEFRAARERLRGRALGLVFLPHDVDAAPLLAAASEALGERVIGATTGGAAFTERGWTTTEVVAGVLAGDDFDYAVEVATPLSRVEDLPLQRACNALVTTARHHADASPSLMVLGDGLAMGGGVLTETLARCTPAHWRIFGGTAGDGLTFERGARVFVGGRVLDDAAVLVSMFTAEPLGVAVEHGWTAVESARELVVTAIDGHILRELDGEPAAEVYDAELRRLGLATEGEEPLVSTARHELGAASRHGELLVRATLDRTPDGGLVLAAAVPLGTAFRVVSTTPQDLIAAAGSVGIRCVSDFAPGRSVRGALVFDCAARLQHLGPDYPAQTRAFAAGRAFPIVGTTSYGEVAEFGGSLEGFHNAAAVMAAW